MPQKRILFLKLFMCLQRPTDTGLVDIHGENVKIRRHVTPFLKAFSPLKSLCVHPLWPFDAQKWLLREKIWGSIKWRPVRSGRVFLTLVPQGDLGRLHPERRPLPPTRTVPRLGEDSTHPSRTVSGKFRGVCLLSMKMTVFLGLDQHSNF